MNKEMERRSFTLDNITIERRDEGKSPKIIGHAAVFNTLSGDLGGFREQIAPGAFTKAIAEDDVRALFNHDANYIIGRNKSGTLKLSEDKQGLYIEIEPPDTQVAKDLMISMERGDITQMSFAFSVRPNGQNWGEDSEGNLIRTLTDLRLFDVSPVVYPAYEETDVAVRSLNAWKEQNVELEPQYSNQSYYEKKLKLAQL